MAKLQDIKSKHKNQFYFHTLAMNNSKMKFKKILKQYQKRINRNKFKNNVAWKNETKRVNMHYAIKNFKNT